MFLFYVCGLGAARYQSIQKYMVAHEDNLRGMYMSFVPKLEDAVKQLWVSFSPSYLQNLASNVRKPFMGNAPLRCSG